MSSNSSFSSFRTSNPIAGASNVGSLEKRATVSKLIVRFERLSIYSIREKPIYQTFCPPAFIDAFVVLLAAIGHVHLYPKRYRFSIYGIRDSWRTRGEIFYLAIAAARAGRAFRFRGKPAGDRIAARIELVTLLDRSAIALFPVVDYPVSARRPYHHLSMEVGPRIGETRLRFFLRNNAIVEISLRRNEPRWESFTRFHWNHSEKSISLWSS